MLKGAGRQEPVMTRAWLLLLLLAPMAGAWDGFHGDGANTGVGPDAHQIYGSEWWRVDLGAFVAADPLALDGLVIVADRDGGVTALDAVTGEQRWQHATGAAIHGTPVAASGRLFVADAKGTLLALDLQSGAVLAEANVGPTQGDLTHHQGKVFLGTEAGEVKAYTSDLDLLWTFDTAAVGTVSTWNNDTKLFVCSGLLPGKPVRGAPAVADGLVVFGGMDHHVFAVDEHGEPDGTTTIRWMSSTGDLVLAAPVLGEDRAFIASYDGTLRSLPTTQTGTDPCFGRIQVPTWSQTTARIHATPAWDGTTLVVARTDGTVQARDSAGAELWAYDAGAPVSASPVIANGTVLVGDDGGTLSWLSLANGTKLASFQADGALKSGPALLGEATFIVTENGIVSRLAPGILQLPDLVIESASYQDGALNVVVANVGAGDAPGTILSIEANGTEVDFAIVPALAAGTSTNLTLNPELPEGTEQLLLRLDPDDTVREESEANSRDVAVQEATLLDDVARGLLGLPLWVWIVAGVASLGGGGGGGFWFWWRRRE